MLRSRKPMPNLIDLVISKLQEADCVLLIAVAIVSILVIVAVAIETNNCQI